MPLKEYIFGFKSEDRACKWLEQNGYEIKERNFRSKFGEIDIIATKDEVLHFIEVKATYGDYEAIYRVNKRKFDKILKTINFYFITRDVDMDFQVDVVVIDRQSIKIIDNITN